MTASVMFNQDFYELHFVPKRPEALFLESRFFSEEWHVEWLSCLVFAIVLPRLSSELTTCNSRALFSFK